MTLTQEGRIGERRFAVLRKKGTTSAYQCLECMEQTAPDPRRFEQHVCKSDEPAKARPASRSSKKDGDA